MSFTIEDMHREVALLVHACLGEVSENFLYVALIPEGKRLIIQVALEREDAEDRESIEENGSSFDAAHEGCPDFRIQVLIGPESASPPDFPAQVTWLRKQFRTWDGEGGEDIVNR